MQTSDKTHSNEASVLEHEHNIAYRKKISQKERKPSNDNARSEQTITENGHSYGPKEANDNTESISIN